MTYQQICYARLGRQESWAGWQTLNATDGIASDVSSSFSAFQKGDMGNINLVDPRHEGLQNFVLRSDGASMYLMSFKYGFADQTGRPSAFCHGLVFGRDEFERDPQIALGVERSSFGWTERGTRVEEQHVSVAPRVRLEGALDQCGLGAEDYSLLLDMTCEALGFDRRNDARFGPKGAFWREDPKTRTPFCIVCDCTESTIRALLVCIYEGLPRELRSQVSFCTLLDSRGNPINRANPVSITFVQRAPQRAKSFVLGAARGSRPNPCPAFVHGVSRDVAGAATYLDGLERTKSAFCDQGAGTCLVYELAAQGAAPVDFAGSAAIREYLELPVPKDPPRRSARDQMLAWAIHESMAQEAAYPAEINGQIARQASSSGNQSLKRMGFAYRIWLLTRLSAPEAASALRHEFPTPEARSTQDFVDTRDELMRTGNGRSIVKALYDSIEQDMLDSGLTEQGITDFLDELSGAEPAWRQSHEATLWRAFILKDSNGRRDPEELADFLDAYCPRCGSSGPSVRAEACQSYWSTLDFGTYGFEWKRYHRLAVKGLPECDAAHDAAMVIVSARVAASHYQSALSSERVETALAAYDSSVEDGAVSDSVRDALDRGLVERLVGMRDEALQKNGPLFEAAHPNLWTSWSLWYDVGQLAESCGEVSNPTAFLLGLGLVPADRKALDSTLAANLSHDSGELRQALREECDLLRDDPNPEVRKGARALAKGLERYAKGLSAGGPRPLGEGPHGRQAPGKPAGGGLFDRLRGKRRED